jgi:hypothetical protein
MKEGGGFEVPEFTAAKELGQFSANLNRVPVLEIGNHRIGQSRSIGT